MAKCGFNVPQKTYHQVSNDDGGQEEGDADLGGDDHAVPHGLDPLPAQDPEDDHEAVHEVNEVPPRQFFGRKPIGVVW